MALKKSDFLQDIWAFDRNGNKVYPYKGERGPKKGLFSVNFTNDTNNFEGLTEEQLIKAILRGEFKERGTIRMLPLNYKSNEDRSAFSPKFYKGKLVKEFN
jgi:hypothetical protein